MLEIFVKEQCFEKQCFDNKKWKEFSSVMDRPMFLNMSKNLLSFGETSNMKFHRCFFKSFHWVMLAFWQIDMCNDWKNELRVAPSACDFQKVYLRSNPCCNNCQVILFLFQRLDIMFILSSSPKVGICSNRSNLHISSFLRFVPFLFRYNDHNFWG